MKFLILLLSSLLEIILSFEVKFLNDSPDVSWKNEVWTWGCTEGGLCKKFGLSEGQRPVGPSLCKLYCSEGALWPRPARLDNLSTNLARINPHSVTLHNPVKTDNTDAAEVFSGAFEVFSESIRQKDKQGTATGYRLEVHLDVKDKENFRYTQGANENYTLEISTSDDVVKAVIVAECFLGARHGLETLSQLVVEDSSSGQVFVPSAAKLADGPTYTHRGIVLDTARNFVSVPVLKRTLDAMAYNKLNTFHWHITDSHSFPMESKSFPKLTKFGAYSKDKVYSEDEIHDLVRYAEIRGIRIVPEFDAPAHVGEGWGWAEGAVVCFAAEPWQKYCVEPPCGQLDPTADLTYTVLGGIYADMADLFKSDHFHMGGDEVNLNCWNSTAHIVSEMEKMNISRSEEGFHVLWSKFQDRAREMVREKFGERVRPVLWTSSLTEGSRLTSYLNNSDYVIQIWTKGNDAAIANLVNNGFQVILSNYDALYFDCGFGAWVGTGNNWCSPYIPWQKVYENDPAKVLENLGVPKDLHKLALGAEAALWTEQADDASVENRLWPRAAALGEALWSGPGKWTDAEHRLLVQRERLIERGILADTVQPEWCSQNQGACYL